MAKKCSYTYLNLLAYVSTQTLILSSKTPTEVAVSGPLSFSRGSKRGTRDGVTAIPLSSSSNALYRGMCLAISNTESFLK